MAKSTCIDCGYGGGPFRTDPYCEGCAMRRVEEARATDEVTQAKELLRSAMARYAALDEPGQGSREDDLARILSQLHAGGDRVTEWCREQTK